MTELSARRELLDDIQANLGLSRFVFCCCCCTESLGPGAAPERSRAFEHGLRLPLAEALHQEANPSDAELSAICEDSQDPGLEGSALQSQQFTERHSEGLGRVQQMHTESGASAASV